MFQNKYFYFLCFCLIFLTGCWDVVNIEERGFIVGSAIDIQEGENNKHPELIVTDQIVVPAGMISPSQESGGGELAFLNLTSTGKSIYKMEEEIAAISSKVPYFEHLGIIAISEDVAKIEHLFSNLLDSYIRDVNLRRGAKIVVSKDEAKKLLDFTTPNYKLPARNIEEILEKGNRQAGLLKSHAVGDIEEFHFRNNSFILPYLTIEEYLAYKAGAVFHGPKDKMVGIFNDNEMHGLGMIRGEHTAKVIDLTYKEKTLALEVIRLRSKMSVDPKGVHDINVSIDIEIEAIIKESFHQGDLTKSSEIEDMQTAVSNEVRENIVKVIQKGQGELGTDVFGVWQQLQTKHYDIWKQVKDDWEEGENYFKNVNFDVNVSTEIYSTGTTNKTK